MEITEDLSQALHALVRAADAAEASPSDRQTARRAIEQAQLVVLLAKEQGFGGGERPGYDDLGPGAG